MNVFLFLLLAAVFSPAKANYIDDYYRCEPYLPKYQLVIEAAVEKISDEIACFKGGDEEFKVKCETTDGKKLFAIFTCYNPFYSPDKDVRFSIDLSEGSR